MIYGKSTKFKIPKGGDKVRLRISNALPRLFWLTYAEEKSRSLPMTEMCVTRCRGSIDYRSFGNLMLWYYSGKCTAYGLATPETVLVSSIWVLASKLVSPLPNWIILKGWKSERHDEHGQTMNDMGMIWVFKRIWIPLCIKYWKAEWKWIWKQTMDERDKMDMNDETGSFKAYYEF
jgi:hypothetical protein